MVHGYRGLLSCPSHGVIRSQKNDTTSQFDYLLQLIGNEIINRVSEFIDDRDSLLFSDWLDVSPAKYLILPEIVDLDYQDVKKHIKVIAYTILCMVVEKGSPLYDLDVQLWIDSRGSVTLDDMNLALSKQEVYGYSDNLSFMSSEEVLSFKGNWLDNSVFWMHKCQLIHSVYTNDTKLKIKTRYE